MNHALTDTHGNAAADKHGRPDEAFYRQLFEDNPQPMWIYDLTTLNFLAVNDAAVAHYGYTREEFLGMKIGDIRPAEDVPALMQDIQKVTQGYHNAGIWRHRKKDGSIVDMEIATHTLDYFGRSAKVVLAIDVTERRRAEQALRQAHADLELKVQERTAQLTRANNVLEQEIRLHRQTEQARRESEDRFLMLFEQSPDAIFVEDFQGLVLDANPAACKLQGLKRDQLIGRNIFDLAPQENRDLIVKRNLDLTSGNIAALEAFSFASDGRAVPTEIRARRIRYADQPALLLHVRDISERRKAEEERKKFPARLLEAQEEERRQISLVIHDELGQLLTLARMDLASLHVSDTAAQQSIESAIQKIDETMTSLRRMAVSLRPPMLDDLGLLAAMETLVEEFSRSSNIQVHFQAEGHWPRLSREYETCLYRILQEALTNALKHSGATRVDIKLTFRPPMIYLEIRDNGRGMTPDAADTRHGIGLLGAQERLVRLGGSLHVESNANQGTTIKATLSDQRLRKEPPCPSK